MLPPLESESPTDALENKEPLVQNDTTNVGRYSFALKKCCLLVEYRLQHKALLFEAGQSNPVLSLSGDSSAYKLYFSYPLN